MRAPSSAFSGNWYTEGKRKLLICLINSAALTENIGVAKKLIV